MNTDVRDTHIQLIKTWQSDAESSSKDLKLDQLYVLAIENILQVAASILSEFTLDAILERVINQSQKMHPVLNQVTRIEPSGFSIAVLLTKKETKEKVTVILALNYLLVEILSILENLTAGVLNPCLYKAMDKAVHDIKLSDRSETENI